MPSLYELQLAEAKASVFDVVMIGDSITYAWRDHPRPWQNIRVLNLGFPGDRTQNVLWRIEHGVLDGVTARLVMVLIGTNHLHNEKKAYSPDTPADVAQGVEAVIEAIRTRLPKSKIWLFSILPRKPGAENDRVIAVNRLLPGCANGDRVIHIDIGGTFQRADRTYKELLYNRDGLHLNAAGYDAWAGALRPLLIQEEITVTDPGMLQPAR